MKHDEGMTMESGPAVFAGTVLTLFGTGLLLWTGLQARVRAPVVQGGGPGSAVLCVVTGAGFLAAGVWCFLRI